MQEKIFLTYTSATAIPYQGSTLGHHAVLNYIDSSGYHHTLQGTPEHKFEHNIGKMGAFLREEALSDGANNTDSPFGRLRVEPQKTDSGSALDQPRTMIAEGDDLSSQWALMRDFADEVNSTGYEYRPISQNSNSFAGGALQRAGFFGPGTASPERFDSQTVLDPVSGETKSFYVPGFEKPLANPINTATPMPFPLDAPAAPLIPTNGVLAPGRAPSFDDRFGNWGSAPADSNTTRSPVLRALQNYKKSAPAAPSLRDSFGDRFGDWTSSPTGGASGSSNQPAPAPEDGNPKRGGAAGFPILRSRVVPRAGNASPAAMGIPSSSGPLSQSGRPLGIFTGEPMPDYPVPLPIWAFPDKSAAAGDDGEDSLSDLIKLLVRR
jgi:hypothetical protein